MGQGINGFGSYVLNDILTLCIRILCLRALKYTYIRIYEYIIVYTYTVYTYYTI